MFDMCGTWDVRWMCGDLCSLHMLKKGERHGEDAHIVSPPPCREEAGSPTM